jgi:CRISPR-associated protein Csb1
VDSRGTQAKVPRIFRSVVRTYNVRRVTRSAQYVPPVEYKERGLVNEVLDKGKGEDNVLSREGFKHNPAVGTPGGRPFRSTERMNQSRT